MAKIDRINFPFELKQASDGDDGYFHVRGYANTFGVDLGDDEIMPGAFKKSLNSIKKKAQNIEGTKYKSMIPALWQHNWDEPIGSHVELFEDDNGLFSHSIYPLNDNFVSGRVKPQVMVGSIKSFSIGFRLKAFEFVPGEKNRDETIRRITELDLREASLVTFPMNENSLITEAKSAISFNDLALASSDTAWNATEAIERIKKFTKSDEKPSEKYRKAFLWFDKDNLDDFSSYKIPIADVVDGEMKAIPKAILMAAGTMKGANGGVDVPKEERKNIKSHVEKYYTKMDKESPFKSSEILVVNKEMLCDFTNRDLENLFRNGVSMSRSAAKTIISRLDTKNLRDADQVNPCDAEKEAINTIEEKLLEMQIMNKLKEINKCQTKQKTS